jgi:hypothetical protein
VLVEEGTDPMSFKFNEGVEEEGDTDTTIHSKVKSSKGGGGQVINSRSEFLEFITIWPPLDEGNEVIRTFRTADSEVVRVSD